MAVIDERERERLLAAARTVAGGPKGGRISRQDIVDTIQSHLSISDVEALDVIMAGAIAIFLPGDPLWLQVVAPPGGTKTELLRTLHGPDVVTISTLTPNTLISGLKGDGRQIDLLPKLDGKLLVVKDFTSILSKKAEDAAGIFADLREAYDGYLEKGFGSGVGTKGYHARFGLLAGVTPAIDSYRTIHNLLGERFLRINVNGDGAAAIKRASESEGGEKAMREELRGIVGDYLGRAREWVDADVMIEARQLDQLRALAEATATLRSAVARDRRGIVLYQPEPEIGTRLVKQLMRLAKALANWRERLLVTAEDYVTVRRVALDGIPKQRLAVLKPLIETDKEWLSTKDVGDGANVATDTARETLEDLWMLKLTDRFGASAFQWRVKESTKELLTAACIEL